MTESNPSPDERSTSLIDPVDLPETFDGDDIYIMKRLLHALHAHLVVLHHLIVHLLPAVIHALLVRMVLSGRGRRRRRGDRRFG